MKFGNCSDCGDYKYLEDGDKCPTCLEDSKEEWVVLRVGNMYGRMRLYKKGLDEDEAKDIADLSGYLLAKKLKKIDTKNRMGYN
jgi:hypothetical protein